MAITTAQQASNVALNRVYGSYLDSAGSPAAAAITIGFLPSYVKYVDATNRIQWEWYGGPANVTGLGMANGTTLKTVAAGTRTLDTADVAISVAQTPIETTFTGSGYKPVTEKGTFVVTIGAAAITQNSQGYFVIQE